MTTQGDTYKFVCKCGETFEIPRTGTIPKELVAAALLEIEKAIAIQTTGFVFRTLRQVVAEQRRKLGIEEEKA